MARIIIPFVGGSALDENTQINIQRAVNCYPIVGDGRVKAVRGTSGLASWYDLGTGAAVRGLWLGGNALLYAVSGGHLYEITTVPAATDRGAVGSGTKPVSMEDNGTELVIVDEVAGYVYDFSTTALTAVAGIPTGGQLGSVDTYILATNPNDFEGTGQREAFYISGPGDALTWSALDYASAEGYPDKIVTLMIGDRETWLLGERTCEIWENTGGAFPFTRISGTFSEYGIVAPFSAAEGEDSILWLSRDRRGEGRVVRTNGYQPQIISTDELNYQIATYLENDGDISDAIAFTYQQRGHVFYVLTFPTASRTHVYDLTTGIWHERSSFVNGEDIRWRANCHAYFNGVHLVGGYDDGIIYQLDPSTYTDAGGALRRIRQTQVSNQNQLKIFMNRLGIRFRAGVGLVSGQGSNPQVMLQWSDDGNTWGNEVWRSIGAIGEYSWQTFWNRMGSFRNRWFRLMMTDPVPFDLVEAYADVDLGMM